LADATTWERTGELRWFPRSMFQAADFVLHEAWRCRETGEVRWEKIKTATAVEVEAHWRRGRDE
jgi:hypothetical protein